MKLTVKNFGPIGEAKDIRISPMTLFVGPSNTGKSYLAVLLYAVVQSLTELRRFYLLRLSREKSDIERKFKESMSLPDARFAEHLAEMLFPLWAQGVAAEWKRKTEHCLGEACELLFKNQNEKMSVVLSLEDDAIHLDLTAPENSHISPSRLRLIGSELHLLDIRKSIAERDEESRIEMAFYYLHFMLLKNLSIAKSHYLPATRGGIMQMRHALTDATIERASLPKEYSAPYTGVTGDFVRKLLDVPVKGIRALLLPINNEDIVPIGKKMEADIMGGGIEVLESETGYPEFRYQIPRNKGDKIETLSLQHTSAMVSELAPVSVFIRYHLEKNHLFIVEEPETNLHPAAQCDIADILVQLANAGVFVLATTHSAIVLEQISNAVRSAGLKGEKTAAKNGGVSLNLKNAAAYSFAAVQKGKTKVRKVEFESDDGFMTDDHLKASTKLYNETVELMDGNDDD